MARLLAFFVLCCSVAWSQSYTWSPFSGRPPLYGVVDGTGSSVRFNFPSGIATDAAGNVYVADGLSHTIRKITPAGVVSTFAGAAGEEGSADGIGGAARFSFPTAVAVDLNGNLYVADRFNHAIRKISPTGVVSTLAGQLGTPGSADGTGGGARFNEPMGVVADAAGNVFVADRVNSTLRRVTAAGVVTTIAGTPGAPGAADGAGGTARFRSPLGLALDLNGALYVADSGNHTVRKVTPDGTVSTLAGTAGSAGTADGTGGAARFNSPYAVAVDAGGNVFVADANNDCIRRITPGGAVSVYAGAANIPGSRDGERTVARFLVPTGVALATNGELFVSDSRNHSIRRITVAGEVSLFAGPGGNFGTADGAGATASYDFPNGIAIDGSDRIYVTDSRNGSIRRITPEGVSTTLVGGTGIDHVDGVGPSARLNFPYGIHVSPDGTLTFAEQLMHTVRRVSTTLGVTTFAGTAGSSGGINGTGSFARFNFPSSVVRDQQGDYYVADTGNHVIRKIAANSGAVFTYAGAMGVAGSNDGLGVDARFNEPIGLAIDAAGNVYVADSANHTIRRIAPDTNRTVTTVAGIPGSVGGNDGTTAAARFSSPAGIAVDRNGTLFIADTGNATIRRIAGGSVTTIGGFPGVANHAPGTGGDARFYGPNGIAIDSRGALYVVEWGNNLIMKGVLDTTPVITVQPRAVSVAAGGSATLSVEATGGGLSYQWKRNGTDIAGANGAAYTITNASGAAAGDYSVVITNSAGSVTSATVRVQVDTSAGDVGRLTNLSILTSLSGPGDVFTVGYVVAGTGASKSLLVRAAGPSLTQLGVGNVLADPRLEVFAGSTSVGGNDNWNGTTALTTAFASVGAFPYLNGTSRDAAVVSVVAPGNNSVRISATDNGSGTVIAEVYDTTSSLEFTPTTPRLVNVSVLKNIGTGLTAGFVLGGAAPSRVLIRAVGPTLANAPFNVGGVVNDPQLTVIAVATQQQVAANDDWGGTAELRAAFATVAAFELPNTSRDAAVLVTLQPGNYTVQVNGVGGTSGQALVEVYHVP